MKENKKEMMLRAFCVRIKALRKAHNHTQVYLAQKLHVAKSSVSNWEKGIRLPEMVTIMQLSEIYDVSCEYLLGSSKRPQPYVPEDKFIDKERYLDLHQLCEADQYALKSHYEFLLSKNRG
ncbi:MAG: helix-turn-helix transcriptional regulator [Clostridia bacterium]|nr:helix-turn-helix transcriptional regulator [Clostridia bacterium]